MSSAATHLDPLIGLDIHLVQPPVPGPPIPVPHPHIGIVFDPFDYLPGIGSTLKIGGLHRAQGGSVGVMIPSHVPLGGVFVKPPTNDSEVMMGSSTVNGNGDVFSRLGAPVLSCSDFGVPPIPRLRTQAKRPTLSLPTTFLMSVPSGVVVGGSPTISLMAFAMRAGFAALRKMARKAQAFRKSRKLRRQNGRCANGLDPVDLISGAVFDRFLDIDDNGFRWERLYSTARCHERGSLGYGFRHGCEYRLLSMVQGHVLELPDGSVRVFPPLPEEDAASADDGVTLRRTSRDLIEARHGRRQIVFHAHGSTTFPLPIEIREAGTRLMLFYEPGTLQLAEVRSEAARPAHRYRFHYNERGLLTHIERVAPFGPHVLAAYEYDADDNLVRSTNAVGGEFRFRCDVGHRWLEKSDPRNYHYYWRYDSHGRCIEGWGEDGLWEGRIDYFPEGKETHVHRAGGTWIYRYDEAETIVEIQDPMGGQRSRVLDEQGRLIEDIDCGNRKTRWLLDESNAVIGQVDSLGNVCLANDDELAEELQEEAAPHTAAHWLGGTWIDACTAGPFRAEYDELGRLIHLSHPNSGFYRFEYDAADNLVAFEDRDRRRFEFRIDSWNLVGLELNPLGCGTHYQYNSSECVTGITDPGGTYSRYDYDAKDRLVGVYRGHRLRERYLYDAGDRLVEKQAASGEALVRLEYNEQSLVSKRHLASGLSQFFAYDPRGRVVRASTSEHEVELKRDSESRLIRDFRDGRGVEHGYNGAQLAETTVLGCFVTSYEYHQGLHRWRIVDPTGGVHDVTLESSLGFFREHENGSCERVRFDVEGRCIERHDARSRVEYRYSQEGDLLEVRENGYVSVRYQWDLAHRLIAETTADGHSEFLLDEADNLLRKPGLNNVVLAAGNRLRCAGDESFRYNGRDHIEQRVSTAGTCVRYVYDALDQLAAVIDSRQPSFWSASYDGLGRRIHCGLAGRERHFYWDENRLAAEVGPNGELRVYVYGNAAALVPLLFVDYDSVTADPASGRVYTLFTDQIGMPTRIEDAGGRSVWWTSHRGPYGEVVVAKDSTIEFNLRWPGHYYDVETGLQYNRYRYYDPKLGRYLQSDPAGTEGGLNLYAYIPDPVTSVDLLGLARCGDRANAVRSKLGTSRVAEGVRRARSRLEGQPLTKRFLSGFMPRLRKPPRAKAGDALAGHGSWSPLDGFFRLGRGQYLHTYGRFGRSITDRMGERVEKRIERGVRKVYGPGDWVPNLTLWHGEDLEKLQATSYRAEFRAIRLSELMRESPAGTYHWAACQNVDVGPREIFLFLGFSAGALGWIASSVSDD